MSHISRFFILTFFTMSSVGAGSFSHQVDQARLALQQPLPPLITLGLGMMPDSPAVVGACECGSPFFQLIGGDRIVSVDGYKVDSIDSLRVALSFARSKRVIKLSVIRFALGQPREVTITFPENWWQTKTASMLEVPGLQPSK